MKETYQSQRKTAIDNENKILKALLPHPKTFTKLMEELEISHTGLSKILDRLESKNEIKRVDYSKAYELTNKGIRRVKTFPVTQNYIEEILNEKHRYFIKMGKFRLGYKGISYDILSNTDIDIKTSKVFEDIGNDTLRNLENKMIDIPNIIGDKSKFKGKMVLAFTIDFEDMKEQFLKRNNKDWVKFGIKWENEQAWSDLLKEDDPQ